MKLTKILIFLALFTMELSTAFATTFTFSTTIDTREIGGSETSPVKLIMNFNNPEIGWETNDTRSYDGAWDGYIAIGKEVVNLVGGSFGVENDSAYGDGFGFSWGATEGPSSGTPYDIFLQSFFIGFHDPTGTMLSSKNIPDPSAISRNVTKSFSLFNKFDRIAQIPFGVGYNEYTLKSNIIPSVMYSSPPSDAQIRIDDYTARESITGIRIFNSGTGHFGEISDVADFSEKQETIVLVHGWTPDNQNASVSDIAVTLNDSWVPEAAQTLIDRIGAENVNIIAYDWTAIAGGWSGEIAPGVGNLVPASLVPGMAIKLEDTLRTLASQKDLGDLQIMGHSLGAGIAAKAAERFVKNGYDVDRLTLFDGPDDFKTGLLDNGKIHIEDSVYFLARQNVPIENIYSGQMFSGMGVPYTGAYNFKMVDENHTEVRDWYFETVKNEYYGLDSSDQKYGFNVSEETLILNRSSITEFKENKNTLNFMSIDYEKYSYSETGAGTVDIINTFQTDFCLNSSNYCGEAISMKSGSPILFYQFADITEDLIGWEVNYLPVLWEDSDSFSLFVNDTLVYLLSGKFFSNEIFTTGLIDLSMWSGETVTLTYYFNSLVAGHNLLITSSDLVYNERTSAPVPEPSTFLMLFLGLTSIFIIKRRR